MRLINADALIQSLEKKHEHWHELVPEENKEIEFAHSYALNVIRNAPTADAKPTVIRSKTLFPTKDFMEWAKRIKEVNPNAVVIPCDAEVASAEALQGYTEWLEKIIVDAETFEWLCEDTNDKEWCEENCHYSSIQAECLRHLYEVSKGGDSE